ncbi:hypothetical protein BRAO375_2320003 [Bradyrhizobium sp. ORS 375]|nr:hypothetical protein BRAO375_2320003 [Bradyrhizobium sp. ORS 375]
MIDSPSCPVPKWLHKSRVYAKSLTRLNRADIRAFRTGPTIPHERGQNTGACELGKRATS